MLIDVGEGNKDVYIQFSGEHREPAAERWLAPGVRAGYGEDGELLMLEVFAGEDGQAGR